MGPVFVYALQDVSFGQRPEVQAWPANIHEFYKVVKPLFQPLRHWAIPAS